MANNNDGAIEGARPEIIAVASGKGGTGKTVILACLGYALQRSGHRVLFIDTDTATDGLSLFLLGPDGWENAAEISPQNTTVGYLRAFGTGSPESQNLCTPFRINRGRQEDHAQVYEALVSGRGLYGDREDEIVQPTTPSLDRDNFRLAMIKLFDWARTSDRWDYVLVDTRGGFGFNTTDVCALSDSFFIVTEPDFTSFYQDKNLIYRVAEASLSLERKPTLRGVIVNKATELRSSDASAIDGVHTLDLDNVEASFRNALVDEFSIRYQDTYPIPLDIELVAAYKAHSMPYLAFPASIFSFASLNAFSGLLKTVTVRWSENRIRLWNDLVNQVSGAITAKNESLLARERKIRAADEHNAELAAQVATLQHQIKAMQLAAAHSDERQRRVFLVRSAAAVMIAFIMAWFSWAALSYYADVRKMEFQQRLELSKLEQSFLLEKLRFEFERERPRGGAGGTARE